MTKLLVAFRNFANAPKNYVIPTLLSTVRNTPATTKKISHYECKKFGSAGSMAGVYCEVEKEDWIQPSVLVLKKEVPCSVICIS